MQRRARFIMCALVLVTGRIQLIAADSPKAGSPSLFHPPVRLQAVAKGGGEAAAASGSNAVREFIDSGAAWGHSGPCMWDVDGDGARDLVVGDFSGKFQFFRNIGSDKSPDFQASGYLQSDGQDAKVWIYCCIGSSPHFADLNGDGNADLLSGSYDPGELYLFPGEGHGKFAARQTLTDRAGKPILRKPDQRQKFESFGSWVSTVDWDADGDLDLVIGGFGGEVFVRINEGTPKAPIWSATNTPVIVDGKSFGVDGTDVPVEGHHAAVAVADWDADGRFDLLSGSEKGDVCWLRNIGETGKPAFVRAQELIPAHEGNGYDELLESEDGVRPGIRTQIDVVDFDRDGRLDLLVGDFCTTISPRPELSAEERGEFNRLVEESKLSSKPIAERMEAMRADFKKRYPGDAIYSDEATKEWDAAYKSFRDSDETKQAENRGQELQKAQQKFLLKPTRKGTFNDYSTTRGYVWLFRRK